MDSPLLGAAGAAKFTVAQNSINTLGECVRIRVCVCVCRRVSLPSDLHPLDVLAPASLTRGGCFSWVAVGSLWGPGDAFWRGQRAWQHGTPGAR